MARIPLVLTVLALAGVSLAAQDKPKPKAAPAMEDFRFGVQVGLASGTTDSVKYLTDKKQGYVVGVQGTWAVLSPSHLLRIKIIWYNIMHIINIAPSRSGSFTIKIK